MEDARTQTLQSSDSMVKADITMLVIESRAYAGMLFRQLSRGDGDIYSSYSRFLEIFYQLYLSFKYNARHDKEKLAEWEKKEKIYDEIFYVRVMQNNEVIPATIIAMFDAFLSDVIESGIYNLSSTKFIERGK